MILPDLYAAVPPPEVTIVEQQSPVGAGHEFNAAQDDTAIASSASSAHRSTPRQEWASLRNAGGGIVLSYFWPVVQGQNGFYELTMSSPNVIDIRASGGHGSPQVRRYWSDRGKILLNRVHPFRSQQSEDDIYRYFSDAIAGAAGISIDEVVAHKLDAGQRWTLQRVLVRLRTAFPDKVIVVWDASRWTKETAHLLLAIRDTADAIALETYIPERETDSKEFPRFQRDLERLESHAPGIRDKVLLAIGAYSRMRNPASNGLADHLVKQVRFIAANPRLCGIAGIAIYAPVYLSLDEQRALDQAIHTDITAAGRPAKCDNPRRR